MRSKIHTGLGMTLINTLTTRDKVPNTPDSVSVAVLTFSKMLSYNKGMFGLHMVKTIKSTVRAGILFSQKEKRYPEQPGNCRIGRVFWSLGTSLTFHMRNWWSELVGWLLRCVFLRCEASLRSTRFHLLWHRVEHSLVIDRAEAADVVADFVLVLRRGRIKY